MSYNKYKFTRVRIKKNKNKVFFIFLGVVLSISLCGVYKITEIRRNDKLTLEVKKMYAEQIAEKERLNNLKKQFPGVGEKGLEDAYDAKIIYDKLKLGDYSNNGEKIVFLTFDDGPSKTVTPEILKVLERHQIKATFFITGKSVESSQESKELLKIIYKQGHAIGNHSYSHNYKYLYPDRNLNIENFTNDFNKSQSIMQNVLGEDFKTRVIRCPGGYMSWKQMEPLDDYMIKNNSMISIDWNALNRDAEGKKKDATQLINETIETSKDKEMIVLLMHDTYGKEETAKALDSIIQYYKENNYKFKILG